MLHRGVEPVQGCIVSAGSGAEVAPAGVRGVVADDEAVGCEPFKAAVGECTRQRPDASEGTLGGELSDKFPPVDRLFGRRLVDEAQAGPIGQSEASGGVGHAVTVAASRHLVTF